MRYRIGDISVPVIITLKFRHFGPPCFMLRVLRIIIALLLKEGIAMLG